MDSLFFNPDGTIRKVIPTFRGVGLTDATCKIQVDRYSHISRDGISVNFLDTTNRFKGWKTVFSSPGAWVQYNSVDFGKKQLKNITVKALSETGSTLQIRINSLNGPLIGEIKIPGKANWQDLKTAVKKFVPGIHNLFVILKDHAVVDVDWIRFEK